jgi:uncharacterized membrane protein
MEPILGLLLLLAIVCILSGPVALIISIISLNKINRMSREQPIKIVTEDLSAIHEEKIARRQAERTEQPEVPPPIAIEPPKIKKPAKVAQEIRITKEPIRKKKEAIVLEQQIGTRWVPIAGAVTIIVAAGFFLKYAYDNNLIGPLGRVVIAAIAGLITLAVGELTRRRGYATVAKAVTSLGFALLYMAVFSARAYYGLLDSTPAFVLAILVTAAAMLYAVSVDEFVAASLSLLGGFLTPVIVSTGENRPIPLFCYLAVLGVGAMLCAYYRKWRVVNFLAFAGTFTLYILWFEKFYRPAVRVSQGPPEQMTIALTGLGIFFAIYLILPILYELVRKVKAQNEDVLLVLTNAAVVFYYLWTILFAKYRTELAFCAFGLCIAHLAIMAVVNKRCRADLNLRLALLVIGLFFVTIAIPLYLRMYAVAMAWAAEGVILAVIGLRYRSIWTQLAGAVALLLSIGQLLHRLPMHTSAFQLVFNPAFGTWCFVVAAILVCHIIYRMNTTLADNLQALIVEVLYAAAILTLMAAAIMEWRWHCRYNIPVIAVGRENFIKGMFVIFTAFPLLFLIRPICPRGLPTRISATTLAAVGSIFMLVKFPKICRESFTIFANTGFWIAAIPVAGLFVGAWLLKRQKEEEEHNRVFAAAFGLASIFVLWVLLTEEIYFYWYCLNRFAQPLANWKFLAHMYISVMWAVYGAVLMAIGFWRNIRLLRYVTLGLFAVLLAKVFILDTSTVKSVYRIAAFLATGVTLVGVSYLYQFLKKKGFFETMLADKSVTK